MRLIHIHAAVFDRVLLESKPKCHNLYKFLSIFYLFKELQNSDLQILRMTRFILG